MCCRAGTRAALLTAVFALLAAPSGRGAEKPQYGGVLRVELRATGVTLNPSKWKAGSREDGDNERLASLVFDRLVTLDNFGRFQPQLATEWSDDASAKHWHFALRSGVRFSDGSALTPADVVTALRTVLPRGLQISATANGVAIHSASSMSDLLELLASGPMFIYKNDGRGGLLGTGSFTVLDAVSSGKEGSDPPAGYTQRLRFRFNEDCWSGRPFLDGIDVTLGVQPLKALLDLQLGRADVAELSEETARRAEQSNLRLWTSEPVTVYALKFAAPSISENEKRLREALRLSLDRNAMARVLLQKQAEPAASFLPQWLTGYAFLFETENDLERAKKLRSDLPASMTPPLRIGLEPGNDLLRLVGERVVVNARAAGLMLQLAPKVAGKSATDGASVKEVDAQLVAWRVDSLAPRQALREVAATWKTEGGEGAVPEEAGARYAWEKQMMEGLQVIPLVAVPDFAALDGRVRNWSPAPWGDWRLADVWLGAADGNGAGRGAAVKSAGARP